MPDIKVQVTVVSNNKTTTIAYDKFVRADLVGQFTRRLRKQIRQAAK